MTQRVLKCSNDNAEDTAPNVQLRAGADSDTSLCSANELGNAPTLRLHADFDRRLVRRLSNTQARSASAQVAAQNMSLVRDELTTEEEHLRKQETNTK
jgi:hypothetical protein